VPSGGPADTSAVRTLVAVVICAAIVAGASAAARPPTLLAVVAKRSGLRVHRAVRARYEARTAYDAGAVAALDRDYPPALQRADEVIDGALGLVGSTRAFLVAAATASGVRYDPFERAFFIRRGGTDRSARVEALTRALVDQNYGLRRFAPLRARDRDAALAAAATVDGLAALVSGRRATRTTGRPLQRFLAAEAGAGTRSGRSLLATLRSVGGRFAVGTALRAPPATTEQLLHVDKFLERERALPVPLPPRVVDASLTANETFGELDLRALLDAFGITAASAAAEGWAGGRVGVYTEPNGSTTVALDVRWDSPADATEWSEATARYVPAAFPAARDTPCPGVRACWQDGDRELAFAATGTTTVFASGHDAELVAAMLALESR
jgi:hypothetical protein